MGFQAIRYYNPHDLNTSRIRKPLGKSINKHTFLLTSVVVILGMQTIRVMFPLAIWHRSSAIFPLFVVLVTSFLTPFGLSLLKPQKFRLLTIGGLATTRILEVLIRNADADLWISLAGASFFVLSLPVLLRPRNLNVENRPSWSWASGLLLGFGVDTSIQGIFWTNNLSADQNVLAIPIQMLLTGLALALVLIHQPQNDEEKIDRSWASAALLLWLGPYFLLQLLIFQNQGYISEVFNIALPEAFVINTLGNLGALLGLYLGNIKPSTPKFFRFFAAIILGISILCIRNSHPVTLLFILFAQIIIGWGFSRIVNQVDLTRGNHLIRTSSIIGFSQILFIFLLLLSFGNLALQVELPSDLAVITLSILMGSTLLVADHKLNEVIVRPTKNPSLLVIAILLVLTSVVHLISQTPKSDSEFAPSYPIHVMTYNIHSAVSHDHGQDLNAIAQVIERSDADIVAIQEISRGWLISGGIDMVSWLSHRLDMEAVFAGNADTLWGNAILSRYPILESGSGLLPTLDSNVPRGYLWIKIDVVGSTPLLIINSHLQNKSEDQHVRLAQVPVLLSFWDNSASTILLGDLNATPGAEELNLISNAGFLDAWEDVGNGPGATIPVYQPSVRLDWIWHTSDLIAVEAQVIPTTASDHLPVIASIDVASN